MDTPQLTFNLLTFLHPHQELTFWFTNEENETLCRTHNSLVPDEVIAKFGEQEHYYTSFEDAKEGFLAITKKTKPDYEPFINEDGEEKSRMVRNSAFTRSLLKRYYNSQIHAYFKAKKLLVKPNFIDDTEVWIPLAEVNTEYLFFEKYTVKVQIARITKQPELLITYAGISYPHYQPRLAR